MAREPITKAAAMAIDWPAGWPPSPRAGRLGGSNPAWRVRGSRFATLTPYVLPPATTTQPPASASPLHHEEGTLTHRPPTPSAQGLRAPGPLGRLPQEMR
jgi:hypothetical protein